MLNPTHLHKYQQQTIDHIYNHPDAMLWLDMGLGKTISTLSAFSLMKAMGESKAMLVIAPLRVCQLTWRQEAEKWQHTKHLKFSLMTGSIQKRQRALFRHADVYLVNYESLSWLTTQLDHYFIKQGRPLPFDVLVWDEVSKIKRSQSKRFEAFAPMLHHFKRRIGLTASPCSNGLQDLWGQFYMCDMGQRLGTHFPTFMRRFFRDVGNQYSKFEPLPDTKTMIVHKIKDITIEMVANEYLDIPELTVVDVEIELPPSKREQYRKFEKDFFIELDNGGQVEVFNRAALSSKLIQYTGGIIYNYPDPHSEVCIEEFIHDEKYKALDELIEGSGDNPILLAYNFSSERNELMKRYPKAECLTGVKESDAISIMRRFNAGEIKLLIAHPLSAGHGLNLQGACHTVIWFGIGYNLELYDQFIGRLHRQGQKHPVQCFRILCRDTIDQAVSDALSMKGRTQSDMREAINRYRKGVK